ncbi:MAG: hypothetical protein DMF77_18345 [Acidobacteria bacterium]|nr:MAG: hypothetical protein DMF77_18345 [Acidobacteriota bacterium]
MRVHHGHGDARQVRVTRIDEVARLPAGRERVLEREEVVVAVDRPQPVGQAERADVGSPVRGDHGDEAQADLAHAGRRQPFERPGQQRLADAAACVVTTAQEVQGHACPVRVGEPGAEGVDPPAGLATHEHGPRPQLLEVERPEREVELADLALGQPLVRDLGDLLVEQGVHRRPAIVAPHRERARLRDRARGSVPRGHCARGQDAFLADAQGLEPRPCIGGQVLAGHGVETRAPPVLAAVLDEVAHAGREVLGRAEGAAAGDRDRVSHRVADEATSLRDQQVMLVRAQRERGKRVPGMSPPDAVHVLRRGLQPVVEHDRPQQQHEHV